MLMREAVVARHHSSELIKQALNAAPSGRLICLSLCFHCSIHFDEAGIPSQSTSLTACVRPKGVCVASVNALVESNV